MWRRLFFNSARRMFVGAEFLEAYYGSLDEVKITKMSKLTRS